MPKIKIKPFLYWKQDGEKFSFYFWWQIRNNCQIHWFFWMGTPQGLIRYNFTTYYLIPTYTKKNIQFCRAVSKQFDQKHAIRLADPAVKNEGFKFLSLNWTKFEKRCYKDRFFMDRDALITSPYDIFNNTSIIQIYSYYSQTYQVGTYKKS